MGAADLYFKQEEIYCESCKEEEDEEAVANHRGGGRNTLARYLSFFSTTLYFKLQHEQHAHSSVKRQNCNRRGWNLN